MSKNELIALRMDNSDLREELATLRAENAKLAGDLKAAQGIIVDAGKQVEALKTENNQAMALLKLLHHMDYTQDARNYLFENSDWENYATVVTGIDWLNEQSTAPVVESEAPQVTLTEEEITWLAEAETIEDDCYKSVYRGHPKSLVGKASINSNAHYKLNWTIATLGDYDTPENRTAIEARRKELGLS